jgi:hypothetical protein
LEPLLWLIMLGLAAPDGREQRGSLSMTAMQPAQQPSTPTAGQEPPVPRQRKRRQ